ncbi:MAG TPA: nodulation protein NfeD [Candidatus Limnocylindria bacterium]|jgi:membrane-bound serine protease (ClpP class)|nr:nodulation protein NfeD [Candidatus Limnocylindria bacterium]
MSRLRRALAVGALLLGLVPLAAPAAGADVGVLRLQLTGVIDQINAAYIEEGLRTAADSGAAAVVIEIDSPGGELTAMDDILKAILASQVPVITWVAPEGARAGSAATFITLAGDVAAMAPLTNIGAASVIGGNGEDLPETLSRKVTNDAVARITELARDHGRNEEWAESAVREAASASVTEALEMTPPIVDILAADTDQLFTEIDKGIRADGYVYEFNGEPLPKLTGLPVSDGTMNAGQQFLHILSDPNIAFILFTIGFYGILSELFHPNLISGSLGAIAIVLAFIGSNSLPLNLGGLLLILMGIGLFVLELHFTSYGFLAVGGVVCFLLGAFALYTGVDTNNPVEFSISPILIVGAVLLSLAYFFLLVRGLLQMRANRSTTLPIATLVGAGGTAQTLIAPTGIAYAGGEAWSARSRRGEIQPGNPLRVVAVEGLELIVEPEEKDG